jgi:signal peptidase I
VAKQGEKSAGSSILELVIIVVVALGLALAIQAFLVKPYRIPSGSMLPTLKIGQRVLVNRLGNRFNDPKIGEIVVFHPPAGAEGTGDTCGDTNRSPGKACDKPTPQKASENFIKRVVGLPGDKLSIQDGHVIRNGKRESDPYIAPCAGGSACNLPQTITVPPDHYFMMGDNRGESDDSRFWGPVPRKWIIGGAFATYWPPKQIGLL